MPPGVALPDKASRATRPGNLRINPQNRASPPAIKPRNDANRPPRPPAQAPQPASLAKPGSTPARAMLSADRPTRPGEPRRDAPRGAPQRPGAMMLRGAAQPRPTAATLAIGTGTRGDAGNDVFNQRVFDPEASDTALAAAADSRPEQRRWTRPSSGAPLRPCARPAMSRPVGAISGGPAAAAISSAAPAEPSQPTRSGRPSQPALRRQRRPPGRGQRSPREVTRGRDRAGIRTENHRRSHPSGRRGSRAGHRDRHPGLTSPCASWPKRCTAAPSRSSRP